MTGLIFKTLLSIFLTLVVLPLELHLRQKKCTLTFKVSNLAWQYTIYSNKKQVNNHFRFLIGLLRDPDHVIGRRS